MNWNWKRVLGWTGIAILALIVVAVIIVVIAIETPAFHGYMRSKIEQIASNALNAKVTISNLDFNAHNLTADLSGLTVSTGANEPHPLLTVQTVHVDVNVTSIFRRAWYLNDIEIHHPVVHVYVDQQGRNNLPKLQSSGGSSNTNLFQLGVRHALLDNGEVYYNDQKRVVAADLHDLTFRSVYRPANGGTYSGNVSYNNGTLQFGKYAPLPHNLNAKFVATPSEFNLTPAVLSIGDSRLNVSANVVDYSSPKIQSQFKAKLDVSQFKTALHDASLPAGTVLVDGTAQYHSSPGSSQSALDAAVVNATITSPNLVLNTPKMHGDIRNLRANLVVANGNAQLQNLRADMLGGNVVANAAVHNLAGGKQGKLQAELNNVSLGALMKLMNAKAAGNISLSGVTDAKIAATWHGNLQDLVVHLDESINGGVNVSQMGDAPVLSVSEDTLGAGGGSAVSANAGGASGLDLALPLKSPAAQSGSTTTSNSQAANKKKGSKSSTSNAAEVISALAGGQKKKTIPVKGEIHATYSAKTGKLTFTNSQLKTPQGTISLNGTAGKHSAMQVHLHSVDLARLSDLLGAFQTAKPGQPAKPPIQLAGTANFNGTLRGAITHPELTGRLAGSNIMINGTHWQSVRADLKASSSHVSIQNGSLVSPTEGQLRFDVSAALNKWHFETTNPLSLQLNASNVHLERLAQLAGSQLPASGLMNAKVSIHGTAKNPIGQGRISLAKAKVYGEPLRSAQVQFQGNGQVVNANMNVQLPAGTAHAVLAYDPQTEGYDATLRAIGIQLGQLQNQKLRSMKLAGVMNLTASGKGTLKNPELQASLQIPSLKVQGQNIQNLNLQAKVQNKVANFALNSDVVNTYMRAKGQLDLTGNYVANVSLDTGGIPLKPILAAYVPAEADMLSGQTELHASIHGPLKNLKQVQAQVVIPNFSLNYDTSIHLAAAAPIQAEYRNGVLTIQPGQITGTGTDLRFRGVVPVSGTAPASLMVVGNVDMQLAKIFAPTLTSSGEIVFDVRSTGTLTNPNIHGQVRIENAALRTTGAPIGLQNANGVLTVSNDRVDVTSFKGEVGGGTVSASGGIIYRPTLQFDLGLSAKNIDYVYQDQVRAAMDATLAFTGNKNASTVSGRVMVDRVSFTPDFDLSGLLTSATGVSTPPTTGTFADRIKLDINAQTSPNLDLVSQTLTVRGGANLHVQGTAANPVIVGRVNLNGGDVIFRGDQYTIQQGTIDFVNPNRIQPVVNVAVNTVIEQYNIDMRFQGPIDRLKTVYTSDPALPPVDILNLLAFGKTTEASAAAAATPGTLGAESMLASGLTGYGSGQLGKLAGLSYLSIDPVLGRTGQTPGARIEVQKRVTSNLYVTFATDVTSTQREEIQVQYQINPRWSVTGNRDQNGGFGFEARVHKKF